MKKTENKYLVGVFSHEKLFTFDSDLNRRNSRNLSSLPVNMQVDPHIKHYEVSKNPAKIMMLGIMGSDVKKYRPICIPSNT